MEKLNKTEIAGYAVTIVLLVLIVTMNYWLPIFTGTKTSIAVVRGYSMYPLLRTGDMVMLVHKNPEDIKPGDIVVYKGKNGNFIIHRVISSCIYDGVYYYRVWGDNNGIEDQYQYDRMWGSCRGISYERIKGVVLTIHGSVFKVPYLGLLSFNH
ncbi:MAG: signal peptidase I [Desulfurococcales archaeon]|nr:signal peptidase I [Desulfurococcales archaeon]